MTRKCVLAGCAAVSLVLAVLLAYKYISFQAIGPSNYGRIRLGMTVQDVEMLIGLPPGDHSTRPRMNSMFSRGNWGVEVFQEGDRDLAEADISRQRMWAGDSYWIVLVLDKDGRIVWKKLVKVG
jgi:hypothetical protein